MVQHRSMLAVADNSGAKKLQVIRVLGGYKKHYARVGDIVTCVVKEANPRAAVKNPISSMPYWSDPARRCADRMGRISVSTRTRP